MYKCECGREFEKPNSFNGHKSHCRVHMEACGKLENLLQSEKRRLNNSLQGYQKFTVIRALNKQQEKNLELQQWLSEQHTCEKCGKVMTEKYKSGRFCSSSCAHSRNFSEESKAKKAQSAKDKEAYTDPQGNVHYIKVGEVIPDGYIKGNFKNFTGGDLNTFSDITKATAKKVGVRSLNVPSKKKLELCCEQYISNHNKIVEDSYKTLLKDKAKGKVFTLDKPVFMFAKYPAVTLKHPRGHEGHVFVHILLAEKLLGRHLDKEEIVHHIDEDKEHNSFDNIYIFDNKGSHTRFHNSKFAWLEIKDDTLTCKNLSNEELISIANSLNIGV